MGMILKIDGTDYELPDRITLGEARIIERYAQGEMAGGDGYAVAKLAGMIHIAIRRARPDVSYEEIASRVDEIDFEELAAMMPSDGEENPPEASDESKTEPLASSNGDSEPSSDASPASESPDPSGSQDLDTGFHSFHATSRT